MQPVEAPLIQNDPGFGHRKPTIQPKSYTSWMVGGLVALAVLFVFISMYRHNNNYTYAPATTPAPTTGSAVPNAPAAR